VTQEPVSRFLSSRTITNAAMVRVLTEPWFVSSRTIFDLFIPFREPRTAALWKLLYRVNPAAIKKCRY